MLANIGLGGRLPNVDNQCSSTCINAMNIAMLTNMCCEHYNVREHYHCYVDEHQLPFSHDDEHCNVDEH